MNSVKQPEPITHIAYLDNIRALAAFAVVVIHVSAQNWYSVDVSSLAWTVFNCYDSAVRWAVPLFVMISGAVFLNKHIPVKLIFTKYIPRLAIAFIFWSLVYAVNEGGSPKTILINLIKGSFHMWYIPMLIGIYLFIPVYSRIVENDGVLKYFLGVSLFTAFLFPHTVFIVEDFGPKIARSFVSLLEPHLQNVKSSMMLGYSAYFVLGYYLNKAEFSKKQRHMLYILSFASYIVTVVTTYLASQRTSSPNDHYYSAFTLNTLVQAATIFIFFKYHGQAGTILHKICVPISKASFGIYWVHVLLQNLLDEKLMLNTLSFFPAISVPVISIVVFSLSFALSWIIGHMPFLKRYLV